MRPLADETPTVLIVSNDATAAALLGGLVETFGYRVVFTSVESANESLRRARPRVCMLDCESDACDEAAVARVMMRGVAVVLVGPRALLEGMQAIAARHGVEVVFTPPALEPLGEALRRAAHRPF
jgi:DNA-binding NtrC family response regulator